MQIKQQFEVSSPIKEVWKAFSQPEQLVCCLPGASIDGESTAKELALLFKVKLGPITANFKGVGHVVFDDTEHRGVFDGSAIDHRSNSRVKGAAEFFLTEAGADKTAITVDVNFSITGSLAQFSRENLVRALADQLTQQFADNLQAVLQAPSTTAPAPDARQQDTEITAQTTTSAPQSLNVMRLLWGAFVQWLRRRFRSAGK